MPLAIGTTLPTGAPPALPATAIRPIVFQGTTGLNSTNDLAGLTLAQIQFTRGGFNLYGNPFTLTNGIVATNFSGNSAIYNSFTLATANVLIVTSNGVTLTLYGNLGGSVGVAKTGLGTLIYSAVGNNTYTGPTLVNAGTLEFNVSGPAPSAAHWSLVTVPVQVRPPFGICNSRRFRTTIQ